MKKLLLAVALLCGLALTSRADDFAFRRFRVDGGLGIDIPMVSGINLGANYYIEPKYEIVNKVALGFQFSETFMMGVASDIDFKYSMNFLVTGDYYFSNNYVRPFVGAGVGYVTMLGGSTGSGMDSGGKVGAMARAGIDVWHIRFGLNYFYGGNYDIVGTYDYFGLSVGVFFGGGKKS